MPVDVPPHVRLVGDITTQRQCDEPQGHCFGADGGSGVPQHRRVVSGRGGSQEVWTLSQDGERITKKEVYLRCQFCQKYVFSKEIRDEDR